ncbi:hypothetical protein ACUR5C_07895 [Aliikangiella sp. IMCC44653]
MKKSLLPYLTIVSGLLMLVAGCTSKYPNQNVVGKSFPEVSGVSLEGENQQIPSLFAQENTLLLLGFVQNSQFDIDRWLIGLDMTNTDLPVYELPTLQGMFPQFFKTQINNGMRKGIPKALWKGVITVYEDGDQLQQFTGNTNPNNARVILLDKSGTVRYFYDQGFSVDALKQLKTTLDSIN